MRLRRGHRASDSSELRHQSMHEKRNRNN